MEGIGPARKRALLRRFGGLAGIKEASEDDLAASGIPARVALRLKEVL
ncbi:MAG: helix-hairpin-helix domain-containing protein [Candidatus Dormibacteraceae bacterium]